MLNHNWISHSHLKLSSHYKFYDCVYTVTVEHYLVRSHTSSVDQSFEVNGKPINSGY